MRRNRINNDATGRKQNARSNKTGRKTNPEKVWSEEENISSFSSKILLAI